MEIAEFENEEVTESTESAKHGGTETRRRHQAATSAPHESAMVGWRTQEHKNTIIKSVWLPVAPRCARHERNLVS